MYVPTLGLLQVTLAICNALQCGVLLLLTSHNSSNSIHLCLFKYQIIIMAGNIAVITRRLNDVNGRKKVARPARFHEVNLH